jgi:glycosyltransferase involved in cell wall biosynthesis
MPKFSIIIPTYNRKDLLKERALKSLLNQTYKDFEVIVINDGGEDVSDVIEEYKEKGLDINYISYKENKGPSYARNRGIEIAQGEWIGFLDDDDEYLDNTLEEINKNLNNELRWIMMPAIYTNNLKTKIIPNLRLIKIKSSYLYKTLFKLSYFNMGSFILHKNLFNEIGLLNEDLKVAQDFEYFLRLIENNFRPHFIEKPLYIYYIHKNQNNKKFSEYINALSIIYNKHKEYLENDKELKADFLYKIGWYYLRVEEEIAFRYFKESFFLKPNIKTFLRMIITIMRLNRIAEKIINKVLNKFWLE